MKKTLFILSGLFICLFITDVNSQRSAVSTAQRGTVTRSARSAATPSATTSARTARSAVTPSATTPARTARSAVTTAPSATRTARSATSSAGTRAAVSRAGVSYTPVYTAPITAPNTTTVVDYSSVTTTTTTPRTAEEVAIQLANETACKEQYNSCMDQLCMDTSDNSKIGRCLCSASIASQTAKEKELNNILANITQIQWQTKNLDSAKALADSQGRDFASSLKQVTDEAIAGLGVMYNSSAEDEIFDIFLGEVSDNTVRKEGNAKLLEADKVCQTALELCPVSKKTIQDTYKILAGNDCRVYSNELDQKIYQNKIVLQNAYNQYQIKDTQYNVETTNKFNAEECMTDLNRCMRSETVCGGNLEYCYTDAQLETRKTLCQSVLNQCQGVNNANGQTDVLWKAFKANILARTQYSNQQCYE
ncbi:MAG: hypothetical protein LBR35_00070, partial [Rickettsiales bacterium]|nr:hypothetical protein [Rickettsiales bacterium]